MKRSLTLTVVILGISFNHRWCQFAPLWSAEEMLLYHVLVENDSCMLYIIVYYVFMSRLCQRLFCASNAVSFVCICADIVYPVMTCVGVV